MVEDLRSGLQGSKESLCSSLGDLTLGVVVPSSPVLSFDCWNTSYSEPTCDKYGWKTFESTWVIFVKVTGGMSRDDGGLYPVAETAVWVVKPVRIIGGCKRVEMAAMISH
jgi:hypothetical protein